MINLRNKLVRYVTELNPTTNLNAKKFDIKSNNLRPHFFLIFKAFSGNLLAEEL